MISFADLTTGRMLKDRKKLIKYTKWAQKQKTDTIYKMPKDEFIRQNERTIQIIEQELDRRGVEYA